MSQQYGKLSSRALPVCPPETLLTVQDLFAHFIPKILFASPAVGYYVQAVFETLRWVDSRGSRHSREGLFAQ